MIALIIDRLQAPTLPSPYCPPTRARRAWLMGASVLFAAWIRVRLATIVWAIY